MSKHIVLDLLQSSLVAMIIYDYIYIRDILKLHPFEMQILYTILIVCTVLIPEEYTYVQRILPIINGYNTNSLRSQVGSSSVHSPVI